MTKPLFDPGAKKEQDLQLDIELEGTFPASDPLKITRFPVAVHKPPSRTALRRDRPRARAAHGRSRR